MSFVSSHMDTDSTTLILKHSFRAMSLIATVGSAALFVSCLVASGADAPVPREAAPTTSPTTQSAENFEPTDSYQVHTIEGWRILTSRAFNARPTLLADMLKLLQSQLYLIIRQVPPAAVSSLQKITIWVEVDDRTAVSPCMCYHPDREWLVGKHLNPDKTGGVEIINAGTALDWVRRQPWMTLHELAHGYHDQFLHEGFADASILAAYRNAMDHHLYDLVLRGNTKMQIAYAAKDEKEYFAELSEALFGTNDFYPFVVGELRTADPVGYGALAAAWGVALPTTAPSTEPRSGPKSLPGDDRCPG